MTQATLAIPDVVHDDFTFRATLDAATLEIRLTGTADARSTAELQIFLERVHAEAKRLTVSEAIVDITKLDFMNSSCFKLFISWLTANVDEAATTYKIRFVWNQASYWQRRGLAALQAFATDVIEL